MHTFAHVCTTHKRYPRVSFHMRCRNGPLGPLGNTIKSLIRFSQFFVASEVDFRNYILRGHDLQFKECAVMLWYARVCVVLRWYPCIYGERKTYIVCLATYYTRLSW